MRRYTNSIFVCLFTACLICCGGFLGPQGDVGQFVRDEKLKYWHKSIDRFPDYDYFLVIEATPEQWERIRKIVKLDAGWEMRHGLIGWANWPIDPPRPDWWQEKDEAATYWYLPSRGLLRWIKYENGRVYYKEIKS